MTGPAISLDSIEERMVRRLMDMGATDEEIRMLVAERRQQRNNMIPRTESPIPFRAPPPGMELSPSLPRLKPSSEQVNTGIVEGAKVGAKNMLDLLRIGTGGPVGAMDVAVSRAVSPRVAPEAETTPQKVGQFIGQTAAELPAYMLGGAAARGIGSMLGAGVKNPFLKAVLTRYVDGAGFWKNTAAAVPMNMAEGLATEFALHPENVSTPDRIIRTAIASSAGSIFDGYAGAKLTQQAIRQAETAAQAKAAYDAWRAGMAEKAKIVGQQGVENMQRMQAVKSTIKRADELFAQQAQQAAGPMPTALDLGMQQEGKIGMTEAQRQAVLRGESGADLPTAGQISTGKDLEIDLEVERALQAELDKKILSLEGIKAPDPKEDLLIWPKKKDKPELDSIEEAYNRGMQARLDMYLKNVSKAPIESEMNFMVDPSEVVIFNQGGRASDNINMGAGLIVDKEGNPVISGDPNRGLMTAEELQEYADILSTFGRTTDDAAKAARIAEVQQSLDFFATILTKEGAARSPRTQKKYLAKLSNDFYELLELPGALDKRIRRTPVEKGEPLTDLEFDLANFSKKKKPKQVAAPEPEVGAPKRLLEVLPPKVAEPKPKAPDILKPRVPFGNVGDAVDIGPRLPTPEDLEVALKVDLAEEAMQQAQPRMNAVGPVEQVPVAEGSATVVQPPAAVPSSAQNNGPPIVSPPSPQYNQVVQKTSSSLVTPLGGKQEAKRTASEQMLHIRQKLQDRFIPIREWSQEAYDILSNNGASRRAAQNALRNDGGLLLPVVDANGKWAGKTEVVEGMPMKKIMNLAGTRLNELDALLVAKRTLAQPHYATGMTEAEAKIIVDQLKDDVIMQQLAGEYRKTMNFMLDYAVRLGRINPKLAEKWKTLEYVPLPREFNINKWHRFYEQRRGSVRQIRNIWETTSDQMFANIERAQRNYALAQLAEQARLDPAKFADIMTPVPGQIDKEIFKDELAQFKGLGATDEEALELVELMYNGALDQSNRTVVVFHGGRPQRYRVNEAIQVALDSMNPMELSTVQYALSQIGRPIRATTGAALDLSLVGPVSDILLAAANSPGPLNAMKTVGNSIAATWHIFSTTPMGTKLGLTPSQKYMQAVGAGLGFGGRFKPDIPGQGIRQKTFDTVGEAFSSFLTPLNNAARLGLYLTQMQRGMNPVEAAAFSNKALGNWNTVGSSMRAWAMMTEFFNVGMQGTAAAASTFKRIGINPANITDPQKFLTQLAKNEGHLAAFLTVGVGGITLPTLYFLHASKDDDQINALRKANNYNYWYWRDSDGEVARMKKPGWWLGAMFGSNIEAMLDGFEKEERSRLVQSYVDAFSFNPIPIIMQTGLGLGFDARNPLAAARGGDKIPIVPRGQADVIPQAQGGPETSNIANIGKQAGISPYKIDYFLDQFLGVDGSAILKIVTGGVQGMEGRVPILGRFDVRPGQQTEGSLKFYDDLDKSRKFQNTIREYQIKGDEKGLYKFVAENQEYYNMYPKLLKQAEKIGKINMLLRNIATDEGMTKEAKIEATKFYKGVLDEFFVEYAKMRKEMVQ